MINFNSYDSNTYAYLLNQYNKYKHNNKFKHINMIYDYIYTKNNLYSSFQIQNYNINDIIYYKDKLTKKYNIVKNYYSNIYKYYNISIKNIVKYYYKNNKCYDDLTIKLKLNKLYKLQNNTTIYIREYIHKHLYNDILKQYTYYIYILKKVIKIMIYLLNYYEQEFKLNNKSSVYITNLNIIIYDISYLPTIKSFIDIFIKSYYKIINKK